MTCLAVRNSYRYRIREQSKVDYVYMVLHSSFSSICTYYTICLF